jgi:hypothetical protein
MVSWFEGARQGQSSSCEKAVRKIYGGEPMSTTKESGFEGPLPLSIKPDGFRCYQRGGCDRQALCEDEGECLVAGPPLAEALNRNLLDEISEIHCASVDQPPADALNRNRFDEIAEIIRALTYAEMIEFASGLWSLCGEGEVNGETLPKILHAWARRMELGSDSAVRSEPVPAREYDRGAAKKLQPIDTAPKDRPILAFMLGRWRIAQWKANQPHRRPIPFWSADDLRVTVSRAHQPKWWADLPPSPPEAGA